MTYKELREIELVIRKFVYDENKNMRPEVVRVIKLIQIEQLRRERQRKDMIDNFSPDDYWRG